MYMVKVKELGILTVPDIARLFQNGRWSVFIGVGNSIVVTIILCSLVLLSIL